MEGPCSIAGVLSLCGGRGRAGLKARCRNRLKVNISSEWCHQIRIGDTNLFLPSSEDTGSKMLNEILDYSGRVMSREERNDEDCSEQAATTKS
jgi:hypothetical protein